MSDTDKARHHLDRAADILTALAKAADDAVHPSYAAPVIAQAHAHAQVGTGYAILATKEDTP